ncbi:MAG: NHL repeat-containing protein, partial [Actinomycetota bacterium]
MSVDDKIQQAAAAKAKKKKLIILGVLLLILLIAIAAVLYYLLRKKPITSVISGQGTKAVYMRSIDAGFDWPIGAAVNKNGSRLYVVDSNNRLVKSFNAAGQEVGSFGKSGAGGLLNPLYIAVSPLSGDVYVTDRSTASVSIYSANGEAKDKFVPKTDEASFAWSPLGIAFDAQGNLYVSDATKGNHRILVFDKNGKLKLKFGKEGTKEGEFEYPNGLCVDKDGTIYVADTNNSRVQVFDKKGKLKSIIGKSGKNSVGH